MLTVTMDADAGFLELTVDGPIGDDDYKKAVDAVDQLLTRHPKIDIVEVVKEIGQGLNKGWRDWTGLGRG